MIVPYMLGESSLTCTIQQCSKKSGLENARIVCLVVGVYIKVL